MQVTETRTQLFPLGDVRSWEDVTDYILHVWDYVSRLETCRWEEYISHVGKGMRNAHLLPSATHNNHNQRDTGAYRLLVQCGVQPPSRLHILLLSVSLAGVSAVISIIMSVADRNHPCYGHGAATTHAHCPCYL